MTGGGTLGPVTPLLGIVESWRYIEPTVDISWIGTISGPEEELVKEYGIPFHTLFAPKLSRSNKLSWIFVLPALFVSCVLAWQLLKRIKPSIIFSAGGYVSVPIAWMAKLQGIPVWIHQLDYQPGIANKAMAPIAMRISATFEKAIEDFGAKKTIVVGGVMRFTNDIEPTNEMKRKFNLDSSKPTVLITGGGTGALQINEAMQIIGKELSKKANIIHLTGKGKMLPGLEEVAPNYYAIEMLTEDMYEAYAVADLVVARGGLGTMMELVRFKKPSIIIPISHSHQELNAAVLAEARAAVVLWAMNPQMLKQTIEKLLKSTDERDRLSKNISEVMRVDGADVIVQKVQKLIV